MEREKKKCNATQRNATQRNATQRNATQQTSGRVGRKYQKYVHFHFIYRLKYSIGKRFCQYHTTFTPYVS
jgi:hypothetical protein